HRLLQVAAAEEEDDEPGQREGGDEPGETDGIHVGRYPRSRLMSSAVAPWRRRKIDKISARPITTSAAATTRVKNTNTCPPMSSSIRAKVTNVRLTALSMSSTHMNMTRALRRTSRPMAAMQNISAATVRYQAPGTLTSRAPVRRRAPRHSP